MKACVITVNGKCVKWIVKGFDEERCINDIIHHQIISHTEYTRRLFELTYRCTAEINY